jgi:putative transposase
MPRANRHHLAGYVWHITQRCHRKQFLLKFTQDRRAWVGWLYEARKRYGLCILDYAVTSNHVHLLVRDGARGEIAQSMQLVAGQTAQGYNERKRRRGAFWEDRYHSTAIETGEHLASCLVYIDLNMVRAGVVKHPAEWESGGYHEIQRPSPRYRIIDRVALAEALGLEHVSRLAVVHAAWVEAALHAGVQCRQSEWTESLAVGRREFVERIGDELEGRARYRQVEAIGDKVHVLREVSPPYSPHFGAEMEPLRLK